MKFWLGGGYIMGKKILVNVGSQIVRKLVLTSIVQLDYDFVEFNSPEDLKLKINLLRETIVLMIQELNYSEYKTDFEIIKDISEQGIKTLVISDRYESEIIDSALGAGASDIIILPLKEDVLKSKMKTLIDGAKTLILQAEQQDKKFADDNVIDYEILRANRGRYSISLVMVEFSGILEEEVEWFIVKLKGKLRETDLIFRYNVMRLLLICPFTLKENVVEIENKVRAVRSENYMSFKTKVGLFVYGISYPKDGNNTADLLALLDAGIKNSIFLGSIRGTFNDINKTEKEIYVRMLKKSTREREST